jgi:hypothetical protein
MTVVKKYSHPKGSFRTNTALSHRHLFAVCVKANQHYSQKPEGSTIFVKTGQLDYEI